MKSDLTRRQFLQTVSLAGIALGVGIPGSPLARRAWSQDDPPRKLKVLVLGGTGQTGPHLVRALLDAGHEVTLFNRGNRSDDLFPGVECLLGDRTPDAGEGLATLQAAIAAGRTWDVCIDIWPQIPRIVENTAVLLQKNVGHYMFVSSMSVYADDLQPNQDETAAVLTLPEADTTEYTDELFGNFKTECENRVRKYYPQNHTIYRPGLIVGPRDFSFRGGYWPTRVRRGGEVLAPGDGQARVQFVDGRDLAAFEVVCMERGTHGTFNVVGPHPRDPLTMQRYLETCREVSGSQATFVWVEEKFLEDHEVAAWSNLPCWLPPAEYAGFSSRRVDKALAAGLTFLPLADTVRGTLSWYDSLTPEQRDRVTPRAGLTAEKEQQVLAAWHALKG
jgi:2'-hydroxyisoflavone reductase